MNIQLKSDIDSYVALRSQREELDRKAKELGKEVSKLELKIIDQMGALELSSIKATSGIMVSVTEKSYPRITDKEKVYEWLRDRGFEALFTVNAQTFRGFFNERMKNGEELPSEGVEHFTKSSLSLRGR